MYESILGLKKPIMGLDIGYQTLKVMQLSGEGAFARLSGVVEIAIEPRTLTKEGIKDKKTLATKILEGLKSAKPHPISARVVSSALPESLVFTKSIDIPKMTENEINKNIPYQASEFFPVPANELYLDWQIVGTLPDKNHVDVLVVGAPKIILNSLAETIKLAGLELASMETKPVSDARALISANDSGPYLLLDIGAKSSSIICFDQGTIKLTSTVACGGDDIAQNFQLSIKNISSEIVHLVKYYQNRVGQATIFKKIILAGGGANIPEINTALETSTRTKTEISWPVIKTKTYNPKFATVIGLAMKQI